MSADWIKTAKVGDKVVCDNHDMAPGMIDIHRGGDPKIGDVVTIEDIYEADGLIWFGFVGFEEFDYWSLNYRPVHPRKTDISIFTGMLKTEPAREDA